MFSPTQKKIICAGIACLAFLACVVPWRNTYEGHMGKSVGYRPIFAPPDGSVAIDLSRTLIPMGVVVVATVAGVMLTSRPKPT